MERWRREKSTSQYFHLSIFQYFIFLIFHFFNISSWKSPIRSSRYLRSYRKYFLSDSCCSFFCRHWSPTNSGEIELYGKSSECGKRSSSSDCSVSWDDIFGKTRISDLSLKNSRSRILYGFFWRRYSLPSSSPSLSTKPASEHGSCPSDIA